MLASISLIVTLCTVQPGKQTDDCDSYIVDTYTSLQACTDSLPEVLPTLLRKPSIQGIACERIVPQS